MAVRSRAVPSYNLVAVVRIVRECRHVCMCVCVFRSSCRLSFKLARADLRQPDAEKSRWQAKEKKQGNCATCNTDRHNLQYVIMHIHRLTSSCLISLPLSSSTLCAGTKASLLQYLIFPFPFASLCFVHAVVWVCKGVCVQHKSNKQRDYLHATPLPLSSPLLLQICYMLRALSET